MALVRIILGLEEHLRFGTNFDCRMGRPSSVDNHVGYRYNFVREKMLAQGEGGMGQYH